MVAKAAELTFRYWPAFQPAGHRVEVAVSQRLGKRESVTIYAVDEDELPFGCRTFYVLKQGRKSWDEAYEVRVYDDGETCTCAGSTFRHQRITCRHARAVLYLLAEGVF